MSPLLIRSQALSLHGSFSARAVMLRPLLKDHAQALGVLVGRWEAVIFAPKTC